MATHKSAAKRARQTIRRTVRNSMIRTHVKTVIRTFRTALSEGDKTSAAAALEIATRELRRGGSKGVLHKRNVSRRVSRLMQAANKASL